MILNAKSFWIALGIGMGLVLGETANPQKPVRAKPKIIDLDFTDDDEDWSDVATGTGEKQSPAPRPWVYWSVGAGVVAAGSVGWYLYQDRQDPAVTRTEQIFTDER